MVDYVLIESRDPYSGPGPDETCRLATLLHGKGAEVIIFLVANGVAPTRRHAQARGLLGAVRAGVRVVAHDASLRERGIDAASLNPAFSPAPLSLIVDTLADGAKVVWH